MNTEKLNAIKQIKKELEEFRTEPIYSCGVTVGLINPKDVFKWQITMLGPSDTPYAGGLFFLHAVFPENYPYSAPKIKFTNKMYHLNVDSNGNICISTLRNWTKDTTMAEVLTLIFALFYKQNPESSFYSDRAELFKNNKREFDKNAREWTQKYASFQDD